MSMPQMNGIYSLSSMIQPHESGRTFAIRRIYIYILRILQRIVLLDLMIHSLYLPSEPCIAVGAAPCAFDDDLDQIDTTTDFIKNVR